MFQAQPSGAEEPRPMIVVDDLHVTYKVHASGKRLNASDVRFRTGMRSAKEVHAVRGITFTAGEGETIGVVGHNGSGKSTLFSAMSGLIPPTAGKVWAQERPVLLGVNAALLPQLSGEQNIRLGLMAMGFSAAEASARVDEIADFAELNEFINLPMRTYSAGMGARLRFAIAAAKAHSILLIDEALAVGDRRFRAKSEQRIKELRDAAGTVMIVSHSTNTLREACSRVLWVHKGELRADGDPDQVLDDYLKWTKTSGAGAVGAAKTKKTSSSAKPAATAKPAQDATVTAPTVAQDAVTVPLAMAVSPESATPESETTRTAPLPEGQAQPDARAAARREHFRKDVQRRKRRTVAAVGGAVGGVVVAVIAGAAITMLAAQSAEPRPIVLREFGGSGSETSTEPRIDAFGAGSSAMCAAEDGTVELDLSWQVTNADEVAIGAGASELEALAGPIAEGIDPDAGTYRVSFPCAEPQYFYVLIADGDGASVRVSSSVTVPRELPVEEAPQQPSAPRGPSRPQAPVQPPVQEEVPPPVEQPEQPVPDPQPQPSEPEPEPEPGDGGGGEPGEPSTPPVSGGEGDAVVAE